ncbi:hypothetical protein [Flavobacterium sp.]|uniref:hypothetical protein n=1 Tax=Flavobacterium sp. TaxID=239 RepID=UPI003751BEA1
MNNSKILLVLISLSTIQLSCEGFKCMSGNIRDKQTNLPLDSVNCVVKTGIKTMFTDSIGNYVVCNEMGIILFKEQKITVEFSKPGYRKAVVTNGKYGDTIFLEKLE